MSIKQSLDKAREQEKLVSQRAVQIAELKRLLASELSQRRYMDTIAKHVPILKIPKLPLKILSPDKPNIEWNLCLSDLHTGQRTESIETGGLFEQSTELVKIQFDALWKRLRYLHALASNSVNIVKLNIFQLGDLVDGDGMRASQARGIDDLVTAQTMNTVDLLVDLVNKCLTLGIPVIDIDNVGGNHDRTSVKASYGGLGELGYHDTYAWLIAEIERRMFKQAIDQKRLRVNNHNTFFGGKIVAGHKVVFEHGASFKTSSGSYGGIGWYPIQAAAKNYQTMLDGADIVVMGHFHQAACLPLGKGWQILNGALPPSTPFVQSTFKRVNLPCQVLFSLHDEQGLTDFQPIYLPHPEAAKPGAFWENLKTKC